MRVLNREGEIDYQEDFLSTEEADRLFLALEATMGWHADNEPELGPAPVIASLSLGAERRFDIRHNTSRKIRHLPLSHGSLLTMSGSFQFHWQHRIPRQTAITAPRINLTFRLIHPNT
jgi:alkylated DNA repair dioxygenase AlkB